jgi:hypothetical protein
LILLENKEKAMFQKFNRLFNGHKALYVKQNQYSGEEMLKQLGIRPGYPVIVFMGGTAKMNTEDAMRLEQAIRDGVARAAVELQASVVDGGTDSGTLGMLNAALGEREHTGLYIGVAPASLTHLPNQPTNGHLEPLGGAHTHFVLVEGEKWGDELKPMYILINALAKGTPSLGILVNGGKGTQDEVQENVSDDRKVVVLDGSGRLADKISLQLRYPGTIEESSVEKMSRDGDFTIFDIDLDPDKLAKKIKEYLKPA